ncbi:MAG TPA: alpha/beta fold hydrolase [Solirubrobacterales bacterium]|jgi:alpha-beta hydrolase superfamily lysophospholipase|nr:alpha/beta fold hydrolase [Solirubrobacterales bacterium]
MAASRPFHLSTGDTAIFAVHDPPAAGTEGRAPVLICPPWGWDDVASYRTRRGWAQRLAAAGHHTLRFDLPATGNSDGRPSDPGVLEAWVTAIIVAAGWLAVAAGTASVTALGLGLGGLLGLEAVGDGAPIAAMALWGVPGGGRRFVRETRAFASLQSWTADPDFDAGVTEGWVEAAGFGLSPGTIEALSELAPGERVGDLRSVLAFGRDGIPVDPKLLDRLGGAGVAVEPAPGPGWGEFVSHPERSALPDAVATRFESWLAELPVPAADGAWPDAPAADSAPISMSAGDARETALVLSAPWGETVGVLAEPEGGGDGDLCAVFLNAGAVRMVGPSRLWTETARDWAAAGMPSFRVDLEGIGEADGEPAGTLRVGDFYMPRYVDQVRGVLDELERRGCGRRFLLVGLCAGGYWGFRAAVEDRRVVAAFAVNAGALRWHPDLLSRRAARLGGGRARDRDYWRKLLRGEVERDKVLALLRSLVCSAGLRLRAAILRPFGRSREQQLLGGIEADLDRLSADGKRTLLAFSAKEPLGEEVEADDLERRGARWPGVDFSTLPGSDHTLRPPVAQRAFHELVDDELARLRDGVEAPF